MHTLSQTLLDAQRAASGEPYVQVILADRFVGVTRLAWERLYEGAEADSFHGAALTGSGALLRARLDPTLGKLLWQRTASPGEGSAFGAWTDLGTVSPVSGIAVAARGAAALLFSVGPDQRTVLVRESVDDGATLGSPQIVWDPGAVTSWLAADYSSDGTPAVFFAAGGLLYWSKRAGGGAWSTPQAWPYAADVVSFTGVAARYVGGDWCLAVCGQDAAGASHLWTCVFGDGGSQTPGTWSPLRELIGASVGTAVTYRTPGLDVPDGVPHVMAVEKFAGAGAYTRALMSSLCAGATFSSGRWREPHPFDLSAEHGPALLADAAAAWLTTPAGVWRSSVSPAVVDVSADVLSVTTAEDGQGSRATLVLDDSRAAYTPDAADGALRLGAELTVAWGFRTLAGPEAGLPQRYWVRSWERRVRDGRAIAVIEAVGPWALLEALRTRRQRTWASGSLTVLALIEEILAMAGFAVDAASASAVAQTRTPAFTLLPNESLATALRRLLGLVPDALRFDGVVADVRHLQAADPAVYAYGSGAHPVLESADRPALAPVNHVQVYGAGTLAEALRWPDVAAVGDWLLQVVDTGLTSAAQAQARADAELRRRADLGLARAQIVAMVNCGIQLQDVVGVTEPLLGWAERSFRVGAVRTRLDRSGGRRPLYRQELDLTGV